MRLRASVPAAATAAAAPRALDSAIRDDRAVAQLDDAPGAAGDRHVMGDDDDGVALGMQISSRMRSTSSPLRLSSAPVGSSARITSPPFISARAIETRCCWPPESWPGRVREAVGHAEPVEQDRAARVAAAGRRSAGIDRRHLDIADRGEFAEQMIALEDEAEMLAPQRRQLVRVERADVAAGDRGSWPEVGRSRQPRMFISVDLPEPDAPTIATISPAAMRQVDIESSATTVASPDAIHAAEPC